MQPVKTILMLLLLVNGMAALVVQAQALNSSELENRSERSAPTQSCANCRFWSSPLMQTESKLLQRPRPVSMAI
ncbi:MAG: Spy/CpxP family protein refolding chaperone [Bermanella sp.]